MSVRLARRVRFRVYLWALRRMEREPDFIIPNGYMHRWYVLPRNRFLNVYLHRYFGSDDDRALHDHPWWSLSWMLRGRLKEIDSRGERWIDSGHWRFRSARYSHRLALGRIPPGLPITLFITGPRIRTWGFWTDRCGWLPWYRALEDDGARMRGDAEDC